MTMYPLMRHLPIVFRSMDVEAKTKPLPSVVCPIRADVMTLGNCGHCVRFRRVEFTNEGLPELRCMSARERPDRDDHGSWQPQRVQDLLRVPSVCAAEDTTIAALLPYLPLVTDHDIIPVLDSAAQLLGLVKVAELRQLVAAGIDLEIPVATIMFPDPARAFPDTSLRCAELLLGSDESGQLAAVAFDGTFLGLLSSVPPM